MYMDIGDSCYHKPALPLVSILIYFGRTGGPIKQFPRTTTTYPMITNIVALFGHDNPGGTVVFTCVMKYIEVFDKYDIL